MLVMALRTRGNKNKQYAVRIHRTLQGFYRLFSRHEKLSSVCTLTWRFLLWICPQSWHERVTSITSAERFLWAVCVRFCEALQGPSETRERGSQVYLSVFCLKACVLNQCKKMRFLALIVTHGQFSAHWLVVLMELYCTLYLCHCPRQTTSK